MGKKSNLLFVFIYYKYISIFIITNNYNFV